MFIEMWMVKATLMRSQMGMRSMLLETEGKANLFLKCHRPWLNCVCVPVFAEGRNSARKQASDETGSLAEEIAKESVEGAAWFLNAYSQWEKREIT